MPKSVLPAPQSQFPADLCRTHHNVSTEDVLQDCRTLTATLLLATKGPSGLWCSAAAREHYLLADESGRGPGSSHLISGAISQADVAGYRGRNGSVRLLDQPDGCFQHLSGRCCMHRKANKQVASAEPRCSNSSCPAGSFAGLLINGEQP